ncbi:MAG: hypothetical protein HKN10_18195 [Myxococcales bacterium]|nr:hypothetical protein [Myxococcales bacterium]
MTGFARSFWGFLATLVTGMALLEGAAVAQDAGSDPPSQAAPDRNVLPRLDTLHRPYDRRDFDEVTRQSRLLRNALIGTSAAFAVGVVMVGVSAPRCKPSLGGAATDCDAVRSALLPVGATIALVSGAGMLAASVILGLRNRHRRNIERDIRRRYSERRLHFDAESGGFVF